MVIDSLRQGLANLSMDGPGEVEGLEQMISLLDQASASIEARKGPKKIGEILLEEGTVSRDDLERALEKQKTPIGELLVEMGSAEPDKIKTALEKQTSQSASAASLSKAVRRTEIRVDLVKLDKLVNLVGELVIAETMVTRNSDLNDLELENFDRRFTISEELPASFRMSR
jgi:two-component system, chemotaxis family, sensor kinase CheA